MSAIGFASNTLTITGTTKSDDIRVALSADGKTISAKLNNGTAQSYKAANVYQIKINADAGNNNIVLDSRITAEANIKTCDGNDTVTSGAGNDRIVTGGGNDVVNAGAGNDYVETAGGADRIDLGAGNDKVVAGSGNDTINAGTGKDAMYGEAGDDTINAKNGDVVDAGAGKNTVKKSGSTSSSGGTVSTPAPTQTPTPKPTTTGKVTKLSLVNADTGAVISGYSTLTNGMTLDLSKLPAHLTVVAETSGNVQSAKFAMSDGSAHFVDDSVSYSLGGSSNGKYQAWSVSKANSVKLTVTPYAADGAKGAAGTTTTMTLNLKRSASSVPTPIPSNGPTPTPTTTPAQTGAPQVNVKSISTTINAGQAYHGEATQTVVPGYQVEDASFSWDFGDPTGEHNLLPGFNAAHVYSTPGSYQAKLTVTSPSGQASTQTININVVASNLNTIYVAASGSDSNDGQSQGAAVKTLAKAVALAGSNSQILLKRGDTFQITSGVNVNGNNITITSYGNGSNPTILYTGARNGFPTMIATGKTSANITIRGLTFNSIYSTDGDENGMPHAVSAGGTAITVADNTFLNVGYAVNANQLPHGLLVMDNTAPLATGIRGYFVWCQGSDLVIVGNTVANSTREHIVRSGGTTRFSIAYNDFTNLDRTKQGDANDAGKGVVVVQKGSYGYVAYNDLHGPAGVGPLGGADGVGEKGARFLHAAFEGNTFYGFTLEVHHGAENVTIRGNTSYVNNAEAIKVEPYSNTYGRGVHDLVIDHNVAIDTGVYGNFVIVQGAVDGIDLTNNVYIAPNIKPGSGDAAAVYVNDSNLNSFRTISGNIWPSPSRGYAYARGGMVLLGTGNSSSDYRTPSEWNAMSKVGDDQFADVSLDNAGSFAMKITSSVTSAKLRAAA